MNPGQTYVMKVVSRLDNPCFTRPLPPESDVPPQLIAGDGTDTLLCGHCRFAAAEGVDASRMTGMHIFCPRCHCENEVM